MYRRIFYPTNITSDNSPDLYGLEYKPVSFKSQDGTRINAWYFESLTGENKGTVIHMHSNSNNITDHWMFVGWLPSQGYNVLEFDYRGFGKSFGVAEPKGILEDCVAAIDYVRARPDTKKIFIYGQSIGGMLAVSAAAKNPEGVKAVVAEAPYYCYSEVMDDRIPGEGYHYEKDDAYSAKEYAAKLSPIPLLVMYGTGDSVLPQHQPKNVFDNAKEPKKLEVIPYGRHLDAMTERHGDRYQKLIVEFFESAK